MQSKEKIIETILMRGVEEIIDREHLKKVFLSGKKLRIKFGIDPTAPEIHLGHTVPLRKLRQFQEAGHKIILIIGDFTGQIGDPSGRSETRTMLSPETVKKNLRHYLTQAGKILNLKKMEIRYNSEWHKRGLKDFLALTRAVSIQQVLKREDFQKRNEKGNDITILEALYPLLQGYDSVQVRADVEIGGTDQKFNLLMGRRVQRYFGMEEQDIITLPLLEGTDGIRKMSKSFGNYIGITDKPAEMFGKVMSIPDHMIGKYFELLTETNQQEDSDPYSSKLLLAETITGMYHSPLLAKKTREEFKRVFSQKEKPNEIETKVVSRAVLTRGTTAVLVALGAAKSNSEARRLITQGAVKIDGKPVTDPSEARKSGEVLKVGKHRFFRISK